MPCLIRLVAICMCCWLDFTFGTVGANSTCTFVLLHLLRFGNMVEFDKLPVTGLILAAIVGDILTLSFSLGLSTFRSETEPSDDGGFFLIKCKLSVLAITSSCLFVNVSLLPNDSFSSSARVPSYSRMSSVT